MSVENYRVSSQIPRGHLLQPHAQTSATLEQQVVQN